MLNLLIYYIKLNIYLSLSDSKWLFSEMSVSRMIPSASKTFRINDLAAGREYELCVLAVYDDGITSLTATRVVGCVQFHTGAEAGQCRFIPSQFLGGTMIIIIGGIIVASVLVFIIILMIRYKAYGGVDAAKGKARGRHRCKHALADQRQSPGMLRLEGRRSEPSRPAGKTARLWCCWRWRRCRRSSKSSFRLRTQRRRCRLGEPVWATRHRRTAAWRAPPCPCVWSAPGPTRPSPLGRGPLANMGLLPSELARTRHRFSFDGDYALFQSHSYPRRARTRRHKSTTQLNTDASPPCSRKVTFSSTEWMLESTVWRTEAHTHTRTVYILTLLQ